MHDPLNWDRDVVYHVVRVLELFRLNSSLKQNKSDYTLWKKTLAL